MNFSALTLRRKVILIVASGIICSSLGWRTLQHSQWNALERTFDIAAEQHAFAFELGLASNISIVKEVSGLYAASNAIEADEFEAFAEVSLKQHPSVDALAVVAKVEHDDLPGYLQAQHDDGRAGFSVTEWGAAGSAVPALDREAHLVLHFSAADGKPSLPEGFDLASSQAVSDTLCRGGAAEGPFGDYRSIRWSPGGALQDFPHLSVFSEITGPHPKGATTSYIAASIDVAKVLRNTAIAFGRRDLDTFIYDRSADGSEPLIESYVGGFGAAAASAPGKREFRHTSAVRVGDATWDVVVVPTDAFIFANMTNLPIAFFVTGLALTALVCAHFIFMYDRQASLYKANDALARAKETVRRSEYRLRQIIDLVPHMIYAKNSDGRFVLANKAAAQAYGRTASGIVGRLETELRGGWTASADDLEIIREGKGAIIPEAEFVDSEGAVRSLETTTIPYATDDDQHCVLSVGVDITDRKRAEREAAELESQLRDSQKMEAIGVLAGGIAHDFNNLLGSIIGYSELAMAKAGENPRLKENLAQVLDAGSHASRLVKQILAFSRKNETPAKAVDAAAAIEHAVGLLRPTLAGNVELDLDLDHALAPVVGDDTELHQVIMNLCTNAYQAIEGENGRVSIRLEAAEIGDTNRFETANLKPGPYAKLSITDDGAGMTDDTKSRVFEPFFTTKPFGKGTGMGLSVVHGIILKYGGTVEIDSRLGSGTTISVYLPFAPESAGETGTDTHQRRVIARGNESILLVDDEPRMADMASQMLAQLGYTVHVACSAPAALAEFARRPDEFDLLLTDYVMPVMDGYALAKAVAEIRADLPVVVSSGYSDRISENSARAHGLAGFLSKPYLLQDLSAVVRRAIESHPKHDGYSEQHA